MTTTQKTPTVGELLKEKRDGAPMAPIYRELGVTQRTYTAWEADFHTPGDEYAEILAKYLELDEQAVVWILYRQRVDQRTGGYDSRFFQPTPALAA